jgi:Plasmid pRiA4b ORF-3-like protein
MPDLDLAAAASASRTLTQAIELTRWVGSGRKLTQTGRLTMPDARELVGLLDTGDEIDPVIGDRVFRTRSSEDLRRLTTVLAWTKAAGLLRVVRGRLVPVKKNARLLDQPLQLWSELFGAFDQLGSVIFPSGWYASLVGHHFGDAVGALFVGIAEAGGAISLDDACERVWSAVTVRYRMAGAAPGELREWRQASDRDTRRMVDALFDLGALHEEPVGTLHLTPLAEQTARRGFGAAGPGDAIAQIKVTLLDVEPPVWRRVLVPCTIRLDRLDRVIQAAMGWTNSHLHMFVRGADHYGRPDLDLPMRDERIATLRDLAGGEGDRFTYEYDFGDGWDHEILLEKLIDAEQGDRYPACVAGEQACPPEDSGGAFGYMELVEIVATPGHPDHDALLRWLGIEKGADFDPARFDLVEANRRLDATVHAV